jgi:phosphoribosylamine--glycine ligase
MMRLQSDLADLCNMAIDGQLDQAECQWDPRASLGVVIAAGGYPGDYAKGLEITGIPEATADRKVFHAGTAEKDGKLVTNGGRVLCVVALGDDVAQAQTSAYEWVRQIQWQDAFYRTDIGYRAIQR